MASLIISVLLVNLRYLLMSSSMSVFFSSYTNLHKFLCGLLLTDETFGVAAQQGNLNGSLDLYWMHGLNIAAWINWVIASLLGALLASALPAGLMESLSFSLVSMFIGLVLMMWFASCNKILETVNIMIALMIIFMLGNSSNLSVVVIIAASLSASVTTVLSQSCKHGSH